MKKNEVLTPDIIEQVPLEKQIENALVRENVTDRVISELKEKYSGENMKLRELDDKERYIDICEGRKVVRKIGIITEKLCKAGREDANKIQKLWIKKENEILEKIAQVQDPLDAEIKKFEDEQERIKQEEIRKQEEKYINRQASLSKYGAQFMDGSFVLNHISYELSNIKEADDEFWNEIILPKYKVQFENNESVRVEEENKREQAALLLKQQQEELERQQRELREGQEKLRQQQEESERIIRDQKEKELSLLREKQDTQNKARMQQVMALGLNYSGQYKSFIFEDVAVAEVDIVSYDQEKWDKMIAEITPTIQRCKEELVKREQEKRDKEIEEARQEAVAKEQEKQRQIEIENQRLVEEKRIREAEEAAKATDKDKWNAWIVEIGKTLPVPVMSSPTYKSKVNSANELIGKIMAL